MLQQLRMKFTQRLFQQCLPLLDSPSSLEGDDALRRSWLSAVALHEMALRQRIGRSIVYYQDLLLPVLLNGLSLLSR